MRELHKNPMLYYLLIPVLVGMWPLLVWGVYLPRAEHGREIEGGLCVQGQTSVLEILKIDPDRPNMTTTNPMPPEFSYSAAVTRVANLCKIPSSGWGCKAGKPMVASGKKRQDARVKLTAVSISQAAKFLTTIQSMWPSRLTCENLKLQKKKGMPDQWDVDFSFLYYY
ncbi:MAG: hypothetical protein NTZ17_19610 [Phycisphaerae bacterium]|jgi:hypothetical protein|nr:hypothetical protein [Phycisphaerae bacterium]